MYEETRDQPMPEPFPAPPIFLGKSRGDEVELMHGHSLLCMVYVLYIIDRARQLKLFHFVAPAFAHAFTFQTCEPRQRKRQCKRKDKKKKQVLSFPCHHGAVKFKARWCLHDIIREIGSECKEISGAL